MNDKIPLVDLQAQYAAHRAEFDHAVADCIGRTSFIGGPDHKAFAAEFSDWHGGGFTAPVGNGTDALVLALVELIGRGDGSQSVATASHTFFATAEAIAIAGYRPLFVDIDPATHLMDLDELAGAMTSDVRAIIPVHLYGRMVDMARVRAIADAHGAAVIEDAAQAHGVRLNGVGCGDLSDAVCYSFYPGKNLGAWGDAGAVFSRNEALIARIAKRCDHGRASKYLHDFVGESSRMDGMQAAVLRAKLRHIDDWNAARQNVAKTYDRLLAGDNRIVLPAQHSDGDHVFHLYVVEVEDRDGVLARLQEAGVGAGVHYPVPLHEQPALADLGYAPGDLPKTSRAAKHVLSLPIFPEIRPDQIERVADELLKAVSE